MPLAAYFWKVGATLLALIFLIDFCWPQQPAVESFFADRPAIRIHSDRKWPERIVLDTSAPMMVAAILPASVTEPAIPAVRTEPPADRVGTPAAANSFAMLTSPVRPGEVADRKQPRKTQHVKARSRRHASPQMFAAARQGQFGWFGPRYW